MRFPSPLVEGRLVRRYKRFLADVVLADGTAVTAHCANPGAMVGLAEPGAKVLLSRSADPRRALPYSWELVETALADGRRQLVGIHTGHPNRLVAEALAAGRIAPVAAYDTVRPEVAYGQASRVDFLLTGEGLLPLYLEVKNSHLMREPGLAEFPDCRTVRAARHMDELGDMVEAGHRAMLVYVVQMPLAQAFRVAADYDPAYAQAARRARERGVAMHAFRCAIDREGIVLADEIPVLSG